MTRFGDQLAALEGATGPAVVTDGSVLTGADLVARAASAADWLDAAGVPPGDALPALLTMNADSLALFLAGVGTARPLAPLGPRLTVHELEACLGRLDGGVLLAEPDAAALAGEVAARTGRRLLLVPRLGSSSRRLDFSRPADAVIAFLHTSGTSGTPKTVPLRNDRMGARVALNAGFLELGPGSAYLSISPFHHVAGMGLAAVALGSGAALVPRPRFSVADWVAMRGRGVTHATLAPTMLDILVEAGELAMPGLRLLQYGASPMHPETLVAAKAALPGVRFVSLYGQTEGTPITYLSPADHEAAVGASGHLLRSVGRPVPGLELRIDRPDAAGIGELVARAPHLFAPGPDGWLRTGDLGRTDDAGYVYLSGRAGDTIVRGGENIHPQEVEERLAGHPGVREVAVVGIPDRRWGEVVKAFVVPTDPASPPAFDELTRHARVELAGFKVPTEWELRPELPRNAGGKVLRRVLRGAG